MSAKGAVTSLATIQSADIDFKKFSVENLNALREQLGPEYQADDETLARFLIGKNNDVEKAKEQFIRATDFKRAHWPFLMTTFSKDMSTGKMFSYGVDKEGRPLLVWTSRLNSIKERSIEETGRLAIWWTEYIIKRLPPTMSKITILMDRTGVTGDNADQELVKTLSKVFQDCYPERVSRVIIYPADLLFVALWNVLKWFIDPVTRDKVQPIYYYYGVQQFIEDEYIPQSMGGKSPYEFDISKYSDGDVLSEEEIAIAQAKQESGEALEPIFTAVEGSTKSSKSGKSTK